jgi:hypothetical protein
MVSPPRARSPPKEGHGLEKKDDHDGREGPPFKEHLHQAIQDQRAIRPREKRAMITPTHWGHLNRSFRMNQASRTVDAG